MFSATILILVIIYFFRCRCSLFLVRLRAPRITALETSNNPAEIISDKRVPGRRLLFFAMSEPNKATPMTLPVCRAELSTPEATPE